ncbi:hypothetical protein CLOM_g19242, partial [Closterium sp. NIES-68]
LHESRQPWNGGYYSIGACRGRRRRDCAADRRASSGGGGGRGGFLRGRDDKICDGVFDCEDGSDDGYDFCLSFDCGSIGKTWCREGYQCYPRSGYCDLNYDCTDGSDEEPERCYSIYQSKDLCAPKGLVKCANDVGYCISPQDVCDSIPQCSDGWDELNCLNHTCRPGQLQCPLTGYCTQGRLCDGKPDCWSDKGVEDEDPAFCTGHVCPEGWRKCGDGLQCVEAGKWCDGAVNCLDGSDEGRFALPLPLLRLLPLKGQVVVQVLRAVQVVQVLRAAQVAAQVLRVGQVAAQLLRVAQVAVQVLRAAQVAVQVFPTTAALQLC